MQNDTQKVLDNLLARFKPEIEQVVRRRNIYPVDAALSVIRPYVRASMKRLFEEKRSRHANAKPYTVSAEFWDMTDGQKNADMVGEADMVTAFGLKGVLEQIEEWVDEFGGVEPTYDREKPTERIRSFSSIFSRYAGKAPFRVYFYYPGKKARYMCLAEVVRKQVDDKDADA